MTPSGESNGSLRGRPPFEPFGPMAALGPRKPAARPKGARRRPNRGRWWSWDLPTRPLRPLEGVRPALKVVLVLDVRMSPGPPCSFLPNVTPNGFPRLLGPQAVVRASKGGHPHEHFVVHGHVVESRRAE